MSPKSPDSGLFHDAKLLISLTPKWLKTDEIDETGADPRITPTSYDKAIDPTRVMGIDI